MGPTDRPLPVNPPKARKKGQDRAAADHSGKISRQGSPAARKPVAQVGSTHDGTGLGLPLTKALVEANRATFAIDSAPGQGTLVKVIFPTTRVLAG